MSKSKKSDFKSNNIFMDNFMGTNFNNCAQDNIRNMSNLFNSCLAGAVHKNNSDLSQEALDNLAKNLNDNFQHNMNLGKNCLNCKNAKDIIDLQHKLFECNIKDSMKTYTEFLNNLKNIAQNNGFIFKV